MIIDFHVHIFPDKIAEPTAILLSKNGSIPAHIIPTFQSTLASLGAAGVDVAVNLPVLTKPSQLESILTFAHKINERSCTGSRVISFAGVHPDLEDPDGVIDRIADEGFLGIKIHPDYQGTYFDDVRYIRLLSAAKRRGLITVTHAGFDCGYVGQPIRCTPASVLRVLDKLGGYDRLVLAHLGGNSMFTAAYELVAGKDVYLDTAYVLRDVEPKLLSRFIDRHGEDRILFATDSPWRDIGREVEYLRSLGLGREVEEKIFSSNARKLLGI